MIVDLHLVAGIDSHPRIRGLGGYANEYTGVIVLVLHAVDNLDFAVSQGAVIVVEQPHAALGLEQSMLDDKAAGPYMFPVTQVFAVKNWRVAQLFGGRQRGSTK